MAIRVPKYKPRNTEVIEFEDLNDSLEAVVNELAGSLNEHNWVADSFTSNAERLTFIESDALYQLHKTSITSDFTDVNFYTAANTYKVGTLREWLPIDDLSLTFVSTGGVLWIVCSLQTDHFTRDFLAPLAEQNLRFSIRVNGQVAVEGTLGGLEDNGTNTPGACAKAGAVVLDTVMPISLGSYTVDVLVFNYSDAESYYIGSRELSIVEIRD